MLFRTTVLNSILFFFLGGGVCNCVFHTQNIFQKVLDIHIECVYNEDYKENKYTRSV